MIRESLISWKSTTELLISVLNITDEDRRDSVIEQVENEINKREELQEFIKPPFSEEEQILGKELLLLEKEFNKKLELFMNNIKNNITDQQKKKVSLHAYMDPYAKVFRDGTFYDKKK